MIKVRKLITATLLLIMVTCQTLFVSAADGSKNIIFEGDSGKFVGDFTSTDGFANMEPGEKREVEIGLKNTANEEMRFYMSAEILKNIAKEGNQEAIYTFTIANNNEVFLSTIIGDGTINTSIGEEHLINTNYILLATLGKDESTTITLELELDGDSAGNTYMSKEGELGLVFMAQTGVLPDEEKEKVEIIDKTTPDQGKASSGSKSVKTGDSSSGVLITIVGVSLLLIVILLVKKRKDKKEAI